MASARWLIGLLVITALASASTTTFDSILIAHTTAPYCPTPLIGSPWNNDLDYIACCEQGGFQGTLTTAMGYGKQTVYACCESGYSCTGVPTPMSDWKLDSNTNIELVTLAVTPSPTPAPSTTSQAGTGTKQTIVQQTATVSITVTSTGTYSASGATPIATSSGSVIYQQISVNGDAILGNGNQQTIGQKSGGLSVSEKAGIATGVIGAVLTAISIWYARKAIIIKKKRDEDRKQMREDEERRIAIVPSYGNQRVELPVA